MGLLQEHMVREPCAYIMLILETEKNTYYTRDMILF